jgi:alkylhydroperoxidase family enzyme
VRRLTGDEHLSPEFATTWRTYDLDEKTRTLLEYAEALTKAPATIDDAHFELLRSSGWSEQAIYDATAVTSFFNFSGRMEAASGLPPDEVPEGVTPPEGRA